MSIKSPIFLKGIATVLAAPENRILSLLGPYGLETLPHSQGRSLSDHLRGTRRILQAWNQPPHVQLAGLCHSIYATEKYVHQAIPFSERPQVQAIIGKQAESLAFLFSILQRRSLFSSIESAASLKRADLLEIKVRDEIDIIEPPIVGDVAAMLLVLHLANLAEQTAETKGRPGIWLNQFSSLARNLHKSDQPLPPLFSNCTATISRRDEMELRNFYSQAIMNSVEAPELSSKYLSDCTDIFAGLAEPWIWRSYLASVQRDPDNRKASAKKALDLGREWGTAWDKRLSFHQWTELAKALLKDGLTQSQAQLLKELSLTERSGGIGPGVRPALVEERTTAPVVGMARFFQYLNRIALEKSGTAIGWYPGLTQMEVHASGQFSVVRALESAFESIQREVQMLDESNFHNEAERIRRTGSWKVFMLFEAGRKNEANCRRCPIITQILEEQECVRKSGGLIYLSRLGPRTNVAAHRGPTNMRLRCHLAISIPEGNCGMRVGEKEVRWVQGKCIVFDDYYRHEVWNRTDESRTVLLLDLWHPDLTSEERNALEAIQWYSYQHGLALAKYWKRNEEQFSREGRGSAAATEAGDLPNGSFPDTRAVEDIHFPDH